MRPSSGYQVCRQWLPGAHSFHIPSAGSYPLRFGVVADIGFTINSTITLQNLFDDEPEVFTLGECGLSYCAAQTLHCRLRWAAPCRPACSSCLVRDHL